jgi:hypothetical protein
LHPLNAGYTSLVPKGIASDRLVCQLLRSAEIFFSAPFASVFFQARN